MCGFTYWEDDYDEAQEFCEKHIPDFPMDAGYNQEKYEQLQKEFIISTKGEIGADWANYDDLYYGKTQYSWELVFEGIGLSDIERLERLGILD